MKAPDQQDGSATQNQGQASRPGEAAQHRFSPWLPLEISVRRSRVALETLWLNHLADQVKALLFALAFCSTAAHSNDRIVVVRDDYDRGVQSRVLLSDKEVGKTSADGRLSFRSACAQSEWVKAEPENPRYKPNAVQCDPAKSEFVVKVTWKPIYRTLLNNKQHFADTGDFASVALVWNELSTRSDDPLAAAEAKATTYDSMAKFLQMPDDAQVYVKGKSLRVLPTKEFAEALAAYQKSVGIKATGQLDYVTLVKASKRTSGEILFVDASAAPR